MVCIVAVLQLIILLRLSIWSPAGLSAEKQQERFSDHFDDCYQCFDFVACFYVTFFFC